MEKPCFSATSHMNLSTNLLDDVEEPSLSSLDDSVTSSKDVSPVREDSYSDGEVIRSVMSSTPQKRNEQRRSVSLVDVSKIDAFTSRPLGNMLASWETIGSQSSVGKSRDSGYIHSGSLLSINSAKLSEAKECSEHMGVIMEERNRLKRELEYNEVLINTLQESNNDLRMKCAAAQNRISELRLKCVKHCDCCSQTYNKSNTHGSSFNESVFNESSDSSSSSDTSRSPSPSPPRSQSCRLFTPRNKACHSRAQKSDFSKSEEDSCSDVSAESASRVWPVVRNLTAPTSSNIFDQRKPVTNEVYLNNCSRRQAVEKPFENQTRNFNLSRSQTAECSSFRGFESGSCYEKEASKKFESPANLVSETDSSSEMSCSGKPSCKPSVPCTSNEIEEEVPLKRDGVASSQFHSVEDLLASIVKEKETELEDNKPMFVANEVNGKICVGNFRVWQNSIRVSPKSPFINSPVVTVRNSSPSFDRLNLTKDTQEVNIPLQNNVHLRVSVKPSPGCSSRPISVHSSFANSSNISSKRNMSLSNHSLNYKDNEGRPKSQNEYTSLISRKNSINQETPSKFNSSQFNPEDLTPKRSSSAVFHTTRSSNFKSYDSTVKINNPYRRSSTSSSLTASNSKNNSNRENILHNENLGVTITTKEKQSPSPDSWVNKLKSFKLEKVPFSFLIQSDSSEKVDSRAESSKPLTFEDSQGDELKPQVSNEDSLPHSKHDVLENASPHYSEDFQDCLGMVDELSRRLAHLYDHLKYTQHIGKV